MCYARCNFQESNPCSLNQKFVEDQPLDHQADSTLDSSSCFTFPFWLGCKWTGSFYNIHVFFQLSSAFGASTTRSMRQIQSLWGKIHPSHKFWRFVATPWALHPGSLLISIHSAWPSPHACSTRARMLPGLCHCLIPTSPQFQSLS